MLFYFTFVKLWFREQKDLEIQELHNRIFKKEKEMAMLQSKIQMQQQKENQLITSNNMLKEQNAGLESICEEMLAKMNDD